MLRTKLSSVNEGGVAAGLGALDSVFLFDWLWVQLYDLFSLWITEPVFELFCFLMIYIKYKEIYQKQ